MVNISSFQKVFCFQPFSMRGKREDKMVKKVAEALVGFLKNRLFLENFTCQKWPVLR